MNSDGIEALAKSRDIGKVVKNEIQQILDEIDKTSVLKLEPTYKSVINQPERIGISSASAINPTEITSILAESGFNSFTVNLPRPALNAKSLQLLSANIPQAQVNIQDNALVFWYYRLRTQNIYWEDYVDYVIYNIGSKVTYETDNYEAIVQVPEGLNPADYPEYWKKIPNQSFESPNLFNLYCVRLLPSYYKKEYILNNNIYGYNQTFNSYEELAEQLLKACDNDDLAFSNGAENNIIFDFIGSGYLPHIVGDITISYDETINKFICKGESVDIIDIENEIPEWDATTYYPVQSLIRYTPAGEDETIYYNISPELTFPPDNIVPPTSWREYPQSDDTVWHTYLLAGYNDPNIIKLQGEKTNLDWNPYHRFMPGSKSIYYNGNYWNADKVNQNVKPPDSIWNVDITYNLDDIVYFEDNQITYQSLQNNNQGFQPDIQLDWWQEIYNPWILNTDEAKNYTGLSAVSYEDDFTNILGIPSQPYTNRNNQYFLNNQTLNKILGFTWNGLNMLVPFEIIPDFKLGSLVTLFYNRLRPVPDYTTAVTIAPPMISFFPNTLSTDTYTADAFCNLVYSSVVNIYTRILGGSTTDSVRNTNLLAIVPLNCGNLGVTFTNNFIDNPLTKIDADIYTVEFSFTTETDQPYWFSNNAIITLQLKLGY